MVSRRSYPIPSSEHAFPLRKAACLPGQIGMGGCFLPALRFFCRDNLTGQLVNQPYARGGYPKIGEGGKITLV